MGVEVCRPSAVDVDADLDHAHELHEIHDGLPQSVPHRDNRPWCGRLEPLIGPDDAIAVLVGAAAARYERHRTADRPIDYEGAERPKTMPDRIDRDGRDPAGRHRGRNAECRHRALFAAPVPVAENRDWPAGDRFLA